MIGIAASNLANVHNPGYELPLRTDRLMTLLAEEGLGLEIQLELRDGILSPDLASRISGEKPAFLGFHQPTRGLDMGDPELQDQSYQWSKALIDLAVQTGAQYVVFHLQSQDYWDGLDETSRLDRTERSLEMFDRLVDDAPEGIRLLIENLEFPKYPATLGEIRQVVHRYAENPRVGVALDLGHLWRSGYLIGENFDNHHYASVMKSVSNDWARATKHIPSNHLLNWAFLGYLHETLNVIGDDLSLIHLTGASDIHTHLLPGATPEDPAQPIERVYQPNEMNVHEALVMLGKRLPEHIPVVSEAIGFPYSRMINNMQKVGGYLSR